MLRSQRCPLEAETGQQKARQSTRDSRLTTINATPRASKGEACTVSFLLQ